MPEQNVSSEHLYELLCVILILHYIYDKKETAHHTFFFPPPEKEKELALLSTEDQHFWEICAHMMVLIVGYLFPLAPTIEHHHKQKNEINE